MNKISTLAYLTEYGPADDAARFGTLRVVRLMRRHAYPLARVRELTRSRRPPQAGLFSELGLRDEWGRGRLRAGARLGAAVPRLCTARSRGSRRARAAQRGVPSSAFHVSGGQLPEGRRSREVQVNFLQPVAQSTVGVVRASTAPLRCACWSFARRPRPRQGRGSA